MFVIRTAAYLPRNLTFVAPGTLETSRLRSEALRMCPGATEILAWALGDSPEHGEDPGAGVWNSLRFFSPHNW